MQLSLDQFRIWLAASGVISKAEIRTFLDALPKDERPADGAQLAQLLVRRKLLTAYQAQQIYSGKGNSLVLGNYVILDKLGQGGMGMVLKAEHKRMERIVALKVLSSKFTDSPEALARFHREVKAAAKLEHPNIVVAHDANKAGDTHFLVMQYVDGSDLSAIVRKKGPLSVDRAVSCILQAARGLEYAHGRGVVHRDIKPANLLVDSSGTVKILDMGLARLDSVGAEQDQLTGTGQIMGTVDYMAPEQAIDTRTADARADIYALGITLWYLLTGRRVYEGDSLMVRLLAHRDAPIPSLQAICSGVSSQLDQIFARMVAKLPKDRYQTMSAVIADLEQCQSGPDASPSLISTPGEESLLNAFLDHQEPAEGAPAAAPAVAAPIVAAPIVAQPVAAEPFAAPPVAAPKKKELKQAQALEAPVESRSNQKTDPEAQQTIANLRTEAPLVRRKPQPSWIQNSPRRLWIGAGGGAAVLLLLLVAAVVFFAQTEDGTNGVGSNGSGSDTGLEKPAEESPAKPDRKMAFERAQDLASKGQWNEADTAFRKAVALNAGAVPKWFQTGCWKVGPYVFDSWPSGLATAYPPESQPDPYLPLPAVVGDDQKQPADLQWQPIESARVNFKEENACYYLTTRVWSPEDQEIAFVMKADDRLRLFVNGEMLFEYGYPQTENDYPVTLKPGWNTVLLRVQNAQGGGKGEVKLSSEPQDLNAARLTARIYQVDQLLAAGNADEALTALNGLIDERSEDAALYAKRAGVYKQLEQWEPAEADYQRAVELEPDSADQWYALGDFHQSRKQWEPAIEAFTKHLEIRKDNPFALSRRATCYGALCRWEEAMPDCNLAVTLRNDDWKQRFQQQRASLWIQQGKWQEAARDMQEIAATEAKLTTSWPFARDLALVQLMAGDVEEYRKAAAEMLERVGDEMNQDQARWLVYVFVVAPDTTTDANRDRLLEAAATWEGTGHWKDHLTASVCCRMGENDKAVELFGGRGFIGLSAIAHFQSGDVEKAESLLRSHNIFISSRLAKDPQSAIPPTQTWQAWALNFALQREANRLIVEPRLTEANKKLAADPKNAAALLERGHLYSVLAKLDEALADYTTAVEAKPDLAEALFQRGRLYAEREETDRALADFTKVLQLKPDDKPTCIARGDLYTQQEKWKEAAEDYSRAITEETNDAALFGKRAHAYKALGQWKEAVADWSRALQLKPDNIGYLSERAEAYRAHLKQPEKALADLSRIVELDPENPWRWMGRSGVYRTLSQNDEAMADINQAVALGGPGDLWWSSSIRGSYLAQDGEWAKAAADLKQAFALNVGDWARFEVYREHALLQLLAGNAKGHQAGIARLAEHLADSENADQLRELVFVTIAGPEFITQEQQDPLLEIVEEKLTEREAAWKPRLKAAVLYRAGKFQQAAELFDQNPRGPAWPAFHLLASMAHHKLGDQQQAKKLFDETSGWIKQQQDKQAGPTVPAGPWQVWVIYKSLEREAESLLQAVEDESKANVFGEIVDPNQEHGAAANYRLAGDATFGWKTGQLRGDVDLNGHRLTMDTGGGNPTVFSGVISGRGEFAWEGGGQGEWQTKPSFLAGDRPNTFSATLTILRGTLALNKPDGVCAVSGERLVLGGGGNQAIVQLQASEQIDDFCTVVIEGKHEGRIWTQGHSETVGPLEVRSMGTIDLGEGNSSLTFADSSEAEWDPSKTLTIQNWTAEKDAVRFGGNASGLTAGQLKQIRFENPSGLPTGLYSAKILPDGRLVPDRMVTPADPPGEARP